MAWFQLHCGMIWACLGLLVLGIVISAPATMVVRGWSNRLGVRDSAGVAGQVKVRRAIPNTGGIAIFAAIVLPICAAVAGANLLSGTWIESNFPDWLVVHVPGMQSQTRLALMLVVCLVTLHLLGLFDDRKPLGPLLKLVIMALPALAVTMVPSDKGGDTRLLSLLDEHVGGSWLSIMVTVVWFLVVTNAMNFMDNMDGLSAGVAAVAGSCLMTTALLHGQWFVAGTLGLLIGSCIGFLIFNFPWGARDPLTGERRGASIFMGDGGSLVIGFLLAFLTVRMTYVAKAEELAHFGPSSFGRSKDDIPWHAVMIPLFILAVPLYDFGSVVLIRLSQGKSPFVGDRQHLSHRMERRGLSVRATVVLVYLFTAATGLMAIPLASMASWQAGLVAGQTLLLVSALALFEWAEARTRDGVRG